MKPTTVVDEMFPEGIAYDDEVSNDNCLVR